MRGVVVSASGFVFEGTPTEFKPVYQLHRPMFLLDIFSPSRKMVAEYSQPKTIRRTFLEDIWGGARRGLLKSSSLSQEGGVVQLALRGT
jgi:hypothetical protein